MQRIILVTALLGGLAGALPARAKDAGGVFLCVDAQGRREYRNTGATKGCKRVELPNVSTFPAPRPRAAGARAAAPAQDKPGQDKTPAAAPAGADFPRVDNATQKARDADRRAILEQELRAEQAKLEAQRSEFNNGEPERRGDERNYAKYQERTAQMKSDLNRTQQNVDALQRELSNLR